MGKILVIVPAYNEEESLGTVIEGIRQDAPFTDIVVVNDGSVDSTSRIANEKADFVLDLPYNLGIGGAMQTGYKFASQMDYDIAVQVDADGQHNASEIDSLIKPIIADEADVVVGSRYIEYIEDKRYKAPFLRWLGITIFSGVISFITRQKITDPTSGFRAINKRVIKFFADEYPQDYPEPEAIILLHRVGFRIKEIPITMNVRIKGRSSITFFKSIYYMIKVFLAIMIDLCKEKSFSKGG